MIYRVITGNCFMTKYITLAKTKKEVNKEYREFRKALGFFWRGKRVYKGGDFHVQNGEYIVDIKEMTKEDAEKETKELMRCNGI